MAQTSLEVSLYDSLMWAEEQAKHLSSASQHHVLLYLTINAFRYDSNPENAPVGRVMSGRVTIAQIALRTGLHPNTVSRVLRELQEQAYLLVATRYGNGQTTIEVLWASSADDIRAEIRAGVRALPRRFKKAPTPRPKRALSAVDNVVGINYRSNHDS